MGKDYLEELRLLTWVKIILPSNLYPYIQIKFSPSSNLSALFLISISSNKREKSCLETVISSF